MPIQKLLKFSDAIVHKKFDPSGGYFATIKEDGWNVRFIYSKFLNQWSIVSSRDREIPSLQWMKKALGNINFAQDIIIETEVHNREIPFPIINGMLNRKYEECKDIQITVFDYQFPSKTETAQEKHFKLPDLIKNLQAKTKLPFRIATRVGTVTTVSEMENIFSKFYETEEGIVYRAWDQVPQPGKRNISLIKQKKECEIDALCVDVFQTIGEKDNPSVSMTVERKDGTQFNVVIGRHDLQNKYLTNKSEIIGKVVTISGMEELPSGKLRQPVFKYERFDKNHGDID